MTSCQNIMNIIEKLAPKKLMLEWDNPGLMVGDFSKDVGKILVTLTVTPEVMDYAVKNRFDMIISHHPVIFKPLKSLRWDLPLGKIIASAIRHGIVIYSAHTNLDVAWDGINDVLTKALELADVQIMKKTYEEPLKKIVVFVPRGYEQTVRDAMGDAGAGFIGNYSHCSFNINGTGTFKPLEGTHPFIGKAGNLEHVDEVRVETIVPEGLVKKVISAMLKVHPYEEVAYDIYPVENQGKMYGLGRIGRLKSPMTLKEFGEMVKQKLRATFVKVTGDLSKPVSKVALCGGAAGELFHVAAMKGADVFISGDVKYHDALDALELGLSIIDAGHFPTENLIIPVLKDYLKKEIEKLGEEVEIDIYEGKDPFTVL